MTKDKSAKIPGRIAKASAEGNPFGQTTVKLFQEDLPKIQILALELTKRDPDRRPYLNPHVVRRAIEALRQELGIEAWAPAEVA